MEDKSVRVSPDHIIDSVCFRLEEMGHHVEVKEYSYYWSLTVDDLFINVSIRRGAIGFIARVRGYRVARGLKSAKQTAERIVSRIVEDLPELRLREEKRKKMEEEEALVTAESKTLAGVAHVYRAHGEEAFMSVVMPTERPLRFPAGCGAKARDEIAAIIERRKAEVEEFNARWASQEQST